MRVGIVERGNYKTVEVAEPEGWQFEVNGFTYRFGVILGETRRRIGQLWGVEMTVAEVAGRLNFAEQRYFERMLRGHYGLYRPSTGAYVCLGLVGEAHTCDLALHEMAHAMQDREGTYGAANEVAQEAAAILAEEEFCLRDFGADPHATAQRYVHMLKALPGFGGLTFREQWRRVTHAPSGAALSALVDEYVDAAHGGRLARWLAAVAPDGATRLHVARAAGAACVFYDIGCREMLHEGLVRVRGAGDGGRLTAEQVRRLVAGLRDLQRRERAEPGQPLRALIAAAVAGV